MQDVSSMKSEATRIHRCHPFRPEAAVEARRPDGAGAIVAGAAVGAHHTPRLAGKPPYRIRGSLRGSPTTRVVRPPWPSAAVALPKATTPHVRSNAESSRYPRGAYHLQDSPARTAFVPDDLSESVEVVF